MSKDSNVPVARAALRASRLYTRCDPALFDFETTAQLPGTATRNTFATEPDESEKLDELLRDFSGTVMLVRQ